MFLVAKSENKRVNLPRFINMDINRKKGYINTFSTNY